MSYEINPCKACWEKYKNSGCNINTINSCVTQTAAAFAGFPSNNVIANTPAETNWEECVHKIMKAENRNPCEFQLDMAPVFNQVPHYFPELLAESGNPKKALQDCVEKCSCNKMYKNTCIENCMTDHAALQPVPKKESYHYNKRPIFIENEYVENFDNSDFNKNYPEAKQHPVAFWVGFIIFTLLFSVVIIFFFKALNSKKIGVPY